MKLKAMFFIVMACVCMTIGAYAQSNQNEVYRVVLGNVKYVNSGSALTASNAINVLGVVTGATNSGKVSKQAPRYENNVKVAIVKGLSGANRYRYYDGGVELDNAVEGDLVVDAIISNINLESEIKTSGSGSKKKVVTDYNVLVEVMLTMRDAKTGEVLESQQFKGKGMGNSVYKTEEKTFEDAFNSLSKNIVSFLNHRLPLTSSILEVASADKNKVKEVYIDFGGRMGAVKGMHFDVFKVFEIAGREGRTKIGRVKISDVKGDDLSLCKVVSGAKDVKQAVDAGIRLIAVSTE